MQCWWGSATYEQVRSAAVRGGAIHGRWTHLATFQGKGMPPTLHNLCTLARGKTPRRHQGMFSEKAAYGVTAHIIDHQWCHLQWEEPGRQDLEWKTQENSAVCIYGSRALCACSKLPFNVQESCSWVTAFILDLGHIKWFYLESKWTSWVSSTEDYFQRA